MGLQRIEVETGFWSTPAHEHGAEEEFVYVLSGRGLAWYDGQLYEISAGDGLLFRAGEGAHTLYAVEALDVLAFGLRRQAENVAFPRIGYSLLGTRGVESEDGLRDGFPVQWQREVALGAPDLSEAPAERPANIVHRDALEPQTVARPRVERTRRNFGRALESVDSGLQHVEVAAGKESTAQHCHSVEEEIFVILAGDGVLVLDAAETPVRAGSVIVRVPGTGVAHMFRAGENGLVYLAYGSRDPADVCYYPRSNKIAFRGVHLMARVERIEDYWDGED